MSIFALLIFGAAGLLVVLSAISVTYAATATVVETLPNNTGSAADARRKITHDQYNESVTLDSGTTPPATLVAEFLATLSGGALTVDLRALTGTNGASVDGNGLKVQVLRVKNLGANTLTIDPGASNGIDLLGASSKIVIPAGGHFMMYFNDASPDISGTDKTLDLTGTGAQTSEWTIIMG